MDRDSNQESFAKSGFVLVKNEIDQATASALSTIFWRQYHAGALVENKTSYEDRHDYYKPAIFEQLLHKSLDRVSAVVGVPLWPAYSYCRLYRGAASLKPHKDREACEFTATVNIAASFDRPWPFYLRDHSGSVVELLAGPGDYIIFRGTELEHWREALEGEWSLQVFLHYVQQGGAYDGHRMDAKLK